MRGVGPAHDKVPATAGATFARTRCVRAHTSAPRAHERAPRLLAYGTRATTASSGPGRTHELVRSEPAGGRARPAHTSAPRAHERAPRTRARPAHTSAPHAHERAPRLLAYGTRATTASSGPGRTHGASAVRAGGWTPALRASVAGRANRRMDSVFSLPVRSTVPLLFRSPVPPAYLKPRES